VLSVPIAIDARRLQEQPLGGVGRWLANLLPYLAAEADIVLLTDGRQPPAAFTGPSGRRFAESPLWVPALAPEAVWVQLGAARWLRGFAGVFHGTFNQLPALWRGPAVVTVHDLATRHHPEDFVNAYLKRLVWNAQFRQAIHSATVIQTDSAFIRDAVIDSYQVDPARVVVAPPFVDPVFSPARRDRGRELAARLGASGPYIVAGGGARRRGLPVAVEAWARARRGGVAEDLIVVGVEQPTRQPGLIHAGRVADDDWADLLAGAQALCYPTRYEGFGLPAFEAAASGVPVVCAPIGPLPEILGDAPEWCERPTVDRVAAALERLLSDPVRQEQRRVAGLERVAAAPTWADSAAVLIDAYRRAGA
jgi:glycosyltransferase involved in cell wall biosynthesis